MKRLISTVSAAGLLAGALMLPAMLRAEDKPEAKGGGREAFAEHMREKFGLTEEQGAKLKAAHRAKRDAFAASMADLGAATRKLQDQVEDKASEKDLTATLDKIAATRKAMRADEDKFEASLSSILTPTQRAKMVLAMKAHMGGGMRGKHGRMGGGMRGHGGSRGGEHERGGPGHDGPDGDDD